MLTFCETPTVTHLCEEVGVLLVQEGQRRLEALCHEAELHEVRVQRREAGGGGVVALDGRPQ